MKENNIDDGEIELSSDHVLLSNSESSSNIQPSLSMDSFLDDLLKNAQTCTHTHTCNPPGPDAAHTHTCYHTHTQLIPPEEDTDNKQSPGSNAKARRPSGNREAVRKYREKKKAHTAYLEEEVKKLRLVNHQLMKRLHRQAVLETEVLRLRSLFFDLGGKINVELGSFPFQKKCSANAVSAFKEGNCGTTSVNDRPCLAGSSIPSISIDKCGKMMSGWERDCQPATVDCQASMNCVETEEKRLNDSLEMLVSYVPPQAD